MRRDLGIAQTRTNAKQFVLLRSAPALLRNSIANTRARQYNAARANNSGERTALACASRPLAETPHTIDSPIGCVCSAQTFQLQKLDCFKQSSFTAVARLSSSGRYPESDCLALARP